MKLEAVKPAHGRLTAPGYTGKNAVSADSLVAADGQGRGVDKRYAGTLAESGLQVRTK